MSTSAALRCVGRWFKGRLLTFAVGFNAAFVQLFGSATAFYVLPLLGSAQRANWMTAAVCAVSFLANVLYVSAFSHPSHRPSFHHPCYHLLSPPLSLSPVQIVVERACVRWKPDYEEVVEVYDVDDGLPNGDDAAEQSALLTGTVHAGHPLYDGRADDERLKLQGSAHNVDDEIVHLHEDELEPPSSITASLAALSPLYWLVILMILLLSPILYTFTAFGPLEFQDRYGLSAADAGSATSVLYVTIVFSPLAGYIIDTLGYRTLIQFAAASLIPVWFALMTFTSISPYVGMTLLGLTFAVTESNGYAMIVEVVPSHSLGIAYGIAGCGVSLALLVEPAGVGWLYSATGDFYVSDLVFIGLAVAGWAVAGAILWYDVRHGSVMSGPRMGDGEEVEDDEEWGRGVVVAGEGIGQMSMRRTSIGQLRDIDGAVGPTVI